MKLHCNYRFWIENKDGEYILGEGSFMLLKEVEKTKSLSKAAANLEMSYSYAWRKIKKIEKALEKSVVKSSRGGREKGQTLLTEGGKDLLFLYENLEKKVKDLKVEEQSVINERSSQ